MYVCFFHDSVCSVVLFHPHWLFLFASWTVSGFSLPGYSHHVFMAESLGSWSKCDNEITAKLILGNNYDRVATHHICDIRRSRKTEESIAKRNKRCRCRLRSRMWNLPHEETTLATILCARHALCGHKCTWHILVRLVYAHTPAQNVDQLNSGTNVKKEVNAIHQLA